MSGFEFFAFPPRPELAPFVEMIWGVRGEAHFTTESVLPSGAIELMVNFGPVQKVVGHGDRELEDLYRRAWLAGMQDRRLVHCADMGADHIAVRFRPGGAHAFFDIRMDEVTNQVVELELLIGSEATSLRDRLGALPSDRARAVELEAWLLAQRRVHPSFSTVHRGVEMLCGDHYRTSVAEVCDRLGLSNKHLIEQFRRVVGLTPKVIGRVERFQGVIAHCRGRDAVDWQEVTHRFGYADQSHLIREFRRLGGVTPSHFLAHRTPDESNVVVG